MARSDGYRSVVFWLMMLGGAGLLAPGLILPPWLEYQAQLERHRAAETYLVAVEEQLRTAKAQLDHLRNDPAYVMRLAERELGEGAAMPGVETIKVEEGLGPADRPQSAVRDADVGGDELPPELADYVERVLARHPYAQAFVRSPARTVLMGGGGVLILTAILLLGVTRPSHADERDAGD